MSNPARQNQHKLRRFLTGLWMIVLIIVIQVPWPYAAVCTLLAVCLHFAALDGPLVAHVAPQRKSRASAEAESGVD